MTPVPPAAPAAMETLTTTRDAVTMTASPLQQGVESYLGRSSSLQLSLKERKPPTKEEIAAKQRNFNLIFWGRFCFHFLGWKMDDCY